MKLAPNEIFFFGKALFCKIEFKFTICVENSRLFHCVVIIPLPMLISTSTSLGWDANDFCVKWNAVLGSSWETGGSALPTSLLVSNASSSLLSLPVW